MREKRSTILFVLLLPLAAGCSGDPFGPDVLSITDVTVTPTTGAATDYLVVSVRARNTSPAPIRITHCFGLDLEVRDAAGALIWQLVNGYRLAYCVPGHERLSSGESKEWSATWSLRGHDDERVPPGTYEVTAVLRELATPDPRTARSAPFRVDVE